MSTRYTAVFEWKGEPPRAGAGDGWLGGRLVGLSFEDARASQDLVVPTGEERQDTYEVEVGGQMFRTTSQKLVEEIDTLRTQLRAAQVPLSRAQAGDIVDKTAPWIGGQSVGLVQRIVQIADDMRGAPLTGGAKLEEECRYLQSALLSRCGPRAVGESWVDYVRRVMGQS